MIEHKYIVNFVELLIYTRAVSVRSIRSAAQTTLLFIKYSKCIGIQWANNNITHNFAHTIFLLALYVKVP